MTRAASGATACTEKSVARYLAQLDTADLQEPSEELAAKTVHLKEKLVKLESEMQRLAAMEKLMLASPDQQISLTDPDSRSMGAPVAAVPRGRLQCTSRSRYQTSPDHRS